MSSKSTVLIGAMGNQWTVVAEIIALAHASEEFDLYAYHPQIKEIQSTRQAITHAQLGAVWLALTDHGDVTNAFDWLRQWCTNCFPDLKVYGVLVDGIPDIRDSGSLHAMRECIFGLFALARIHKRHMLVSLAGGRKTMTADLQFAAGIFGDTALLHVIDTKERDFPFGNFKEQALLESFSKALPAEEADKVILCCTHRSAPNHVFVCRICVRATGYNRLSAGRGYDIRKRWHHTYFNTRDTIVRQGKQLSAKLRICIIISDRWMRQKRNNLRHSLLRCPVTTLDRLKNSMIATDPAKKDEEMSWLRSFPKPNCTAIWEDLLMQKSSGNSGTYRKEIEGNEVLQRILE